jgi:hypothetical protein
MGTNEVPQNNSRKNNSRIQNPDPVSANYWRNTGTTGKIPGKAAIHLQNESNEVILFLEEEG